DFFSPRVNYFANSVAATRAQQEIFSKKLSLLFPGYSEKVWGVTASDSSKGYTDWGKSLTDPRIDGTVVPSAVAGSLMFVPDICIPSLRTMLQEYGKKIYRRYGFADAFNPTTGWVSRYVIGIDVGITLLSAENLRSGSVWQWFMMNDEPDSALDRVGLVKLRDPRPALLQPKLVSPFSAQPSDSADRDGRGAERRLGPENVSGPPEELDNPQGRNMDRSPVEEQTFQGKRKQQQHSGAAIR